MTTQPKLSNVASVVTPPPCEFPNRTTRRFLRHPAPDPSDSSSWHSCNADASGDHPPPKALRLCRLVLALVVSLGPAFDAIRLDLARTLHDE